MPAFNPTFTEEELQNEEWKPIPGFAGVYSASSLGRIRRDKKRSANTGGTCKVGRILKTPKDKHGYCHVTLCRGGARYSRAVHNCVARTFLGPRPKGKEINHKRKGTEEENYKANNRAGNLEYVTRQENEEHAKEHRLKASGDRNGARLHPERMSRGSSHGMAKLTDRKVKAIRKRFLIKRSLTKLAIEYRVTKQLISLIVKRKIWTHI